MCGYNIVVIPNALCVHLSELVEAELDFFFLTQVYACEHVMLCLQSCEELESCRF